MLIDFVSIIAVDLSKILGGQTKILGAEGGKKVINAWAFLNYWEARVQAAPSKFYTWFLYFNQFLS